MVAVPATKPDTIPVLPIVATVVLLLLQLPPLAVLLSVVLEPAHTLSVPDTGVTPKNDILTPGVN